VKRFILQFAAAKIRLSEKHEFSLVLMNTEAILYLDFTGDFAKISDRVARIRAIEDFGECNINSLYNTLYGRILTLSDISGINCNAFLTRLYTCIGQFCSIQGQT
jgi:hypothetical protein